MDSGIGAKILVHLQKKSVANEGQQMAQDGFAGIKGIADALLRAAGEHIRVNYSKGRSRGSAADIGEIDSACFGKFDLGLHFGMPVTGQANLHNQFPY